MKSMTSSPTQVDAQQSIDIIFKQNKHFCKFGSSKSYSQHYSKVLSEVGYFETLKLMDPKDPTSLKSEQDSYDNILEYNQVMDDFGCFFTEVLLPMERFVLENLKQHVNLQNQSRDKASQIKVTQKDLKKITQELMSVLLKSKTVHTQVEGISSFENSKDLVEELEKQGKHLVANFIVKSVNSKTNQLELSPKVKKQLEKNFNKEQGVRIDFKSTYTYLGIARHSVELYQEHALDTSMLDALKDNIKQCQDEIKALEADVRKVERKRNQARQEIQSQIEAKPKIEKAHGKTIKGKYPYPERAKRAQSTLDRLNPIIEKKQRAINRKKKRLNDFLSVKPGTYRKHKKITVPTKEGKIKVEYPAHLVDYYSFSDELKRVGRIKKFNTPKELFQMSELMSTIAKSAMIDEVARYDLDTQGPQKLVGLEQQVQTLEAQLDEILIDLEELGVDPDAIDYTLELEVAKENGASKQEIITLKSLYENRDELIQQGKRINEQIQEFKPKNANLKHDLSIVADVAKYNGFVRTNQNSWQQISNNTGLSLSLGGSSISGGISAKAGYGIANVATASLGVGYSLTGQVDDDTRVRVSTKADTFLGLNVGVFDVIKGEGKLSGARKKVKVFKEPADCIEFYHQKMAEKMLPINEIAAAINPSLANESVLRHQIFKYQNELKKNLIRYNFVPENAYFVDLTRTKVIKPGRVTAYSANASLKSAVGVEGVPYASGELSGSVSLATKKWTPYKNIADFLKFSPEEMTDKKGTLIDRHRNSIGMVFFDDQKKKKEINLETIETRNFRIKKVLGEIRFLSADNPKFISGVAEIMALRNELIEEMAQLQSIYQTYSYLLMEYDVLNSKGLTIEKRNEASAILNHKIKRCEDMILNRSGSLHMDLSFKEAKFKIKQEVMASTGIQAYTFRRAEMARAMLLTHLKLKDSFDKTNGLLLNKKVAESQKERIQDINAVVEKNASSMEASCISPNFHVSTRDLHKIMEAETKFRGNNYSMTVGGSIAGAPFSLTLSNIIKDLNPDNEGRYVTLQLPVKAFRESIKIAARIKQGFDDLKQAIQESKYFFPEDKEKILKVLNQIDEAGFVANIKGAIKEFDRHVIQYQVSSAGTYYTSEETKKSRKQVVAQEAVGVGAEPDSEERQVFDIVNNKAGITSAMDSQLTNAAGVLPTMVDALGLNSSLVLNFVEKPKLNDDDPEESRRFALQYLRGVGSADLKYGKEFQLPYGVTLGVAGAVSGSVNKYEIPSSNTLTYPMTVYNGFYNSVSEGHGPRWQKYVSTGYYQFGDLFKNLGAQDPLARKTVTSKNGKKPVKMKRKITQNVIVEAELAFRTLKANQRRVDELRITSPEKDRLRQLDINAFRKEFFTEMQAFHTLYAQLEETPKSFKVQRDLTLQHDKCQKLLEQFLEYYHIFSWKHDKHEKLQVIKSARQTFDKDLALKIGEKVVGAGAYVAFPLVSQELKIKDYRESRLNKLESKKLNERAKKVEAQRLKEGYILKEDASSQAKSSHQGKRKKGNK